MAILFRNPSIFILIIFPSLTELTVASWRKTDSIRSISLFSRAVSDACLEGLKLATGLKPKVDNKIPKILKKEDKVVATKEKTNFPEEVIEDKALKTEDSKEKN